MVDKHVPEDGGTVKSRSAAMMVAKATAQRQEICSALVDATTHLLVMLSPLLDSDRARLATDPFVPRPKHPVCALKREEAPARARDLPAVIDGVRWGGAGGAARQDSVGSWPLDLPPRAGITTPYLPYTTHRHESRDIR